MEAHEYILKPSLQQLALRKVAMLLWNQTDILAQVKSFRCQSITDDDTIQHWQRTVENSVKEKVSMLPLPDFIREELGPVIKPIGPAILIWRMYHESLISNYDFALDQLCWTSAGRVDYRKTAEKLIKQEQISIKDRYKLACVYCLEEDIRIIWENLSEDSQNYFGKENYSWLLCPVIVILWTQLIKLDIAKLNPLIRNDTERERRLYKNAFERAAQSGNRAATEYFFQKLTLEEREASLLTTALYVIKRRSDMSSNSHDFPEENFSDVACYLLSQMSREMQTEVFKRLPYDTLACFMDWPWQDLLMKVIGLMWSFLTDLDEIDLIMSILASNSTMTGYNYPKLFGELFKSSPSHYRKYMVENYRSEEFWFSELICGNHTEIIKLVLRNVDDKDREGFITCEKGYHISKKLIEDGKWDLLELFVSECRLSSEAKTILKNGFMLSCYYSFL